jgi:NAD(P)-dependent dehydrogenase (short-subunit alcohol dehydrogenase family)
MKTLQDKVVVITGAGSGIGRALAVSAAKMGAKLCLSDWNEAGLAETVALTQLPPARVSHASWMCVATSRWQPLRPQCSPS